MRLVTFETGGARRLGAVVGERVVDVQGAAAALSAEGRGPGVDAVPGDMLGLLRAGDAGMDAVRSLLDAVADWNTGEGLYAYDVAAIRLCAPVPEPGKILCIGRNYKEHAAEGGSDVPQQPLVFAKFANTVIGPEDDVIHPTNTRELDYEGELVVAIGREAKHVSREQALGYVAGYTIGHDVSARDLQRSDNQWVRAKSQDTFAPLGPYLVTSDEIPDPQGLTIKVWVNGDLRQEANTELMIFDVATLIAFISEGITLHPGDLIFTGTPAGVGAFRKPPVFLQPGDEIAIEIENLGRLTNRVAADPYSGQ